MAAESILCQICGTEAPTRFVEFHQNIGMLLARRSLVIRGNLCKSCVHSQFWKRTLITMGVGWLGTISCIVAPVFVLMNTVRYLGSLGMEGVPLGAIKPALNDAVIAALAPRIGEIFQRLNQGETLVSVARALAPKAGVTPGQVVLYVQAVAASQQQQEPAKTFGFPVQPATPSAVPAPPTASVSTLPAIPSEPGRVIESSADEQLGLQ